MSDSNMVRTLTASSRSARCAARLGVSLVLAAGVLAISAVGAVAAPPANDDFADAIVLSGSEVTLPGQTTAEATGEPGEPDHAGVSKASADCDITLPDCQTSVWHRWTAPSDGEVTIDTCDASDTDYTVLAVYTGGPTPAALSEVASSFSGCSGNSSLVRFTAAAGTDYQIAVAGIFGGSFGTTPGFALHLSQPPPEPNDDFAAAAPLSGSSADLTGQSNGRSNGEAGEPDHAGDSLRNGCAGARAPDPGCLSSVWYTYSSPRDVFVTIDSCDPATELDTVLAVYTGSAVNALTPVASNDDAAGGCPGGGDLASRVTFRASAGTVYRIAVAGFAAKKGSFALHLRTAPAPAGSTPPIQNPPPADLTKPVLSSMTLSPKRFRAASSGPSISARVGTKVSYAASEKAVVRFRVQRALRGRRVGGRCVRPTRANRSKRRCTRYRTLRGAFSHRGSAGPNSFRFSGRLRGRKLRPGRYRLRAVATDAAGNRSPRKHVGFRIVRR